MTSTRPDYQIAYHFLRSDMTAGSGNEPPWTVGEERSIPDDVPIALCESGYHSSPSWSGACAYGPGTMACIVEVSNPEASDGTKQVSRSRKLIAAVEAQETIILWACDCIERALLREEEARRLTYHRFWDALSVARRYAAGEATRDEAADAASHAASSSYNYAAAALNQLFAWPTAATNYATAANYAATYGSPAGVKATDWEWQRTAIDARLNALFAEATP